MDLRQTLVLAVLLGVSATAHLFVWLALSLLPSVEEMLLADVLSVEMVVEPETLEPEPEPEPVEEPAVPEPEPEPAALPEPPPAVRPRPDVPPPEEPPPAEPPPPAEEAIADFTGDTLTNDTGEGWQSATGSGAPMEGPIGQPGAQLTGRRRTGVADGTPGGTGEPDGPRVVAAADLSRQAGPPSTQLADLLRRNYPARARDLGVEGNAVVRVMVASDGRVNPLTVVSEQYEGFGEACRRTLREGPRWEPPLDRQGEAVATRLNFRCTFTIR